MKIPCLKSINFQLNLFTYHLWYVYNKEKKRSIFYFLFAKLKKENKIIIFEIYVIFSMIISRYQKPLKYFSIFTSNELRGEGLFFARFLQGVSQICERNHPHYFTSELYL